MQRRGLLKSGVAALAAAMGATRAARSAQAGTSHIRIYVEMDVAPEREKEMLDAFHNIFVPEATKHEGFIRVKMLKRLTVIQGSVPPSHNYRFELEFENEQLRQKWVTSAAHQRVWPLIERTMTTRSGYPVTLYEEA